MDSTAPGVGRVWRLWALLPLLLLVGAVAVFAASGTSLLDLVGRAPPPADQFDIRRVEFKPGQIRIRVTNPQRQELTIASVTVDDAIVPYRLDGPAELGRLRSSTIVVPFQWVEDDPYHVGVTSSSGIESTFDVPAAVETRGPSPRGFLGYAVIGFLVGVVPVALGLGWLPSLRGSGSSRVAGFMALTAGLLSFLALDALTEALDLQAGLPSGFQGPGLILLGVTASYLGLTFVAQRFSAAHGRERSAPLEGVALATLVAIGIGLHNLGERLALEILRHHRLLELYLARTLEVGLDAVHAEADRLEHALSEILEERIDEALGSPTEDPHGDPIPDATLRIAHSTARRLTDLEPGDRATVQGVPDGDAELLQYLEELGLVPGKPVELLYAEPFGGPITLRAGRRAAISRELADENRVSRRQATFERASPPPSGR